MTFCAAIGTRDFGLVAAETRFRDVFPLADGAWGTGCGWSSVIEQVFRRLRTESWADPPRAAAALVEALRLEAAGVPADRPDQAPIALCSFPHPDGGFAVCAYSVDGIAFPHLDNFVRIDHLANYGIAEGATWEWDRAFKTFLRADPAPSVWDVIRRLAQLALEGNEGLRSGRFHGPARSTSVRPNRLQIGLTIGGRTLQLRGVPNEGLISASDKQLEAMLEPVGKKSSRKEIVGTATRLGFVSPDLYELTPNVTQQGFVSLVIKARGGLSVKFAVSTAGEPTAATVRAATAQALDLDGIYRSGTVATLAAGQTLYVAALAWDYANGAGAESALLTARITHYEGNNQATIVEKARSSYQITYRLQASDADGDTVQIFYRVVAVTSPSDSYTSPSPTTEGGFSAQPHGLEVTVDRGTVDRYIEAWCQDVNGNNSAIDRLAIPAITSSDLSAAINTVSNSFAFVGSCPTEEIDDTVSWTKGAGVPAGWTVDIIRCTGSTSCTPGGVIATDQPDPSYTYAWRTAVQSGVSGPDRRRYGVRLRNTFGDLIEEDYAPSGLSTPFDACP